MAKNCQSLKMQIGSDMQHNNYTCNYSNMWFNKVQIYGCFVHTTCHTFQIVIYKHSENVGPLKYPKICGSNVTNCGKFKGNK